MQETEKNTQEKKAQWQVFRMAIEARFSEWSEANLQSTKQRKHNWKQLGFNVFKFTVSVYKAKPWPNWGNKIFPCFNLNYDFLQNNSKDLYETAYAHKHEKPA